MGSKEELEHQEILEQMASMDSQDLQECEEHLANEEAMEDLESQVTEEVRVM